MAQLTPTQAVWRGRIETGLRFAAPVLDVLLLAGDRLSRIGERDEIEGSSTPPAVGSGRGPSLARDPQ